jgi:hypothetical protein
MATHKNIITCSACGLDVVDLGYDGLCPACFRLFFRGAGVRSTDLRRLAKHVILLAKGMKRGKHFIKPAR